MPHGKSYINLQELSNQVLSLGEFCMGTDEFVTEDAMMYMLNVALAELHDILSNVFQDYFLARADLLVDGANGGDNALLPSDFQRAVKVFYNSGSSRYPVSKFMLDDLNRLDQETASPGSVYRYRILGEAIYFVPPPPLGAGTFELWYVPRYQYLEDWADTVHISVPIMWTDFVVNDVIARLLAKEESDPTYFMNKKEEARNRIISTASQRDAGRPEQVADVTSIDVYDVYP
jgi:hypothetical protein